MRKLRTYWLVRQISNMVDRQVDYAEKERERERTISSKEVCIALTFKHLYNA